MAEGGAARRTAVDRVTLAAFIAMVFTIGGNVVAIKYIFREPGIDPMWAAASRFLVATAIFAGIARALRAPLPRGRALVGALLYGVLAFGAFFGFVYWGLRDAPAGLSGVLLATVPLLTFLLALAHRQERFRWSSLLGAVLVVAGTAVIFGGGSAEGVPVLAILSILAGAACAAEAAIVVKGFPPVHPAVMNAIGMAVGTVILFALIPAFGESFVFPESASTWIAQAYLVTIGSIGVFALFLFILSRWTASAAAYEFVLAPVVAIALSAWLLDEKITGAFAAGSVLVLIGVYFGALRRAARSPGEAPTDPTENTGRA